MPFRHLQHLRIEQRLDALARSEGFETAGRLVADLYVMQRLPLHVILSHLRITKSYFKRHMKEWGIDQRAKGDYAREVKVVVTQELVNEISRDGVRTVAARLGVQPTLLDWRLKKWIKEKK